MKSLRYILSLTLTCVVCLGANAQVDRKEVRQGNRQFKKEEWKQADISYRKALVKDSTSFAGNYNLANNLYRQENYEEAGKYMDKTMDQADMNKKGEDAYFNKGDIAIAKKDWQTAVDALKKAILKDPTDIEAKENYAYAKKMLENQKNNGGGGGGNNDQNQDNQQNENNQDQQNQDQNNQNNNQDQNNQQNQQDQNQDQQNQNGGQQPQPVGISEQQAQQILKAIQAKEKETQDKVNKEKAEVLKSKQKEKNW